jgi:hypothetical protein
MNTICILYEKGREKWLVDGLLGGVGERVEKGRKGGKKQVCCSRLTFFLYICRCKNTAKDE